MPFGHKAKPAMVYEYGLLQPTAGLEEAIPEMRRRVEFWNALVAIERSYQERVAAVLHAFDPALIELDEKVTRYYALKFKVERGKLKGDEAHEARVEMAQLKEAVDERKARRKVAFADAGVQAQLEPIETDRHAQVLTAKRGSGLFWCNADDVLASYEVARRQPGELNLHRWDGSGKLLVRWPQGAEVEELFGTNGRLEIAPVDPLAWSSPARGERRRLARTSLKLRIRSQERKPVWLEAPTVLHRPIVGRVRQAAVIRRRVGLWYQWRLVVTVERAERPVTLARHEAVALDVGWRKVPGGLRVAVWHDTAGKTGELVLPDVVLAQFRKVEDLQSLRDQHFNATRDALKAWLKAAPGVPSWLREETKAMHQWLKTRRMAWLAFHWRKQRFAGDEVGYDLIETWRKRDKHLLGWQANLLDQVERRRREIYRVFAADLARTYDEVVLEQFDLRTMARLDRAGGDMVEAVRWYWTKAAVSVLRSAITQACSREGRLVAYAPSENTTRACHVCGSVEKFDAMAELRHTCGRCGANWDQDENAAKNLLAWRLNLDRDEAA